MRFGNLYILYCPMSFLSKVKNFLCTFDLFSQRVSFRYKEQPEYETATGGFISLTAIIVFVTIFTGTAINTFQREYITFSRTEFQQSTPSYFNTTADDDFMFAVGIQGLNMNAGERYFDIKLHSKHFSVLGKINTSISLQPCHLNQWGNISKQLGRTYDRLNLNKWLCPPQGLILQLQGKPTSQVFSFYEFTVEKCDPNLIPSRPCVSNTVIANHLAVHQTFQLSFYFVNKILNPDSHIFLTYFLDDVNTFAFSTGLGANAIIFVNAYEIETDQSIWPLQDFSNVKGGLVSEKAQLYNYQVGQNTYCRMNLRKSSISIKIDRSFRKADDTLSYIGGLFSVIIALLLIVSLYNELSYELEMAKVLYHDNAGHPIDSASFHFGSFFGYLIFLLFDKIGLELPWIRMKGYHNAIEQVRKQMDIRLVMKKIQFNERVNRAYIDEHKLMLLQLQQPLTLEQCAKYREDYRVYKKIRRHLKDKDSFNFEDQCPTENNQNTLQALRNPNEKDDILVFDINNTIDSAILETEQQKQRRQTKQLFRKLKYSLLSIERQIDQEGDNEQLARNILLKIDSRIIRKFKDFKTRNHIGQNPKPVFITKPLFLEFQSINGSEQAKEKKEDEDDD